MTTRLHHTRLEKTLVAAATLTVLLLFVAVPRSQADDRARCQQRMENAEFKLDQAIRKHGVGSTQANNWRQNLILTREECWNRYHGWWSGSDHQWHTERDWDRYDQAHGYVKDHDHGPDHH